MPFLTHRPTFNLYTEELIREAIQDTEEGIKVGGKLICGRPGDAVEHRGELITGEIGLSKNDHKKFRVGKKLGKLFPLAGVLDPPVSGFTNAFTITGLII